VYNAVTVLLQIHSGGPGLGDTRFVSILDIMGAKDDGDGGDTLIFFFSGQQNS